MTRTRIFAALLLATAAPSLITAASCARPAQGAVARPAAPSTLSKAGRTTDGTLARSNLDAQVASARAGFAAASPAGVGDEAQTAVTLLLARAQAFGTVDDLFEASSVAHQAVSRAPRQASAHLSLAAALAALHEFDASLAEIARADKLGAPPALVNGQRAAIAQARGELAAAEPLRRAAAQRSPNITTLGALGALSAAQGRPGEAEALFDAAELSYRDVSPLPVAWIEFQRGLSRERAGDLRGAAEAYRQALARLPGHAQAAVHLAAVQLALGQREEAARLLRPLVGQPDPEAAALLSSIVAEPEATALRAKAEARYQQLLARAPRAFADHAARFYLGTDPGKAAALAALNARNRPTPEALDLALDAYLRAGRPQQLRTAVCALPLEQPSPRLRSLRAQGCS